MFGFDNYSERVSIQVQVDGVIRKYPTIYVKGKSSFILLDILY